MNDSHDTKREVQLSELKNLSTHDRVLIIEHWSRESSLIIPTDLIPIITAFGEPFLTWSRKITEGMNVTFVSDTKVEMIGSGKHYYTILCVDHCITCDDIPQNTPFDIEYRMHLFSEFMEWGFLPADSNGEPLIEDWKTDIDGNKGYGIYYLDSISEPRVRIFVPEGSDGFMISDGFDDFDRYIRYVYASVEDTVINSGDRIGFRVRRERTCELFVNGESKGVIFKNIPRMIVPAITCSLKSKDLNVCSVCSVQYGT